MSELNEQLEACPFCNDDMSSFVPSHFVWPGFGELYVCCDCGAMGPGGKTVAEAIAAWNRRATPAPQAAPSEAVERIVHLRADRERRIYVAGPMTGLPEYNFPAFNDAAALLRADGWHVENPAEHGHVAGADWADYMRWDMTRIASCGAIYLLPGWEASKGARLEVMIGQALGVKFITAPGALGAVTQAAPSEPVAEVPHVVWEERVACARVADQFAHEEGPGPHRYAGNVISARILARTKSRVATPAPAQQAEGDVSQANARDAARWREAVRNVGFIRCDGGPYWVIGVPCNTYGNSDEQFTAAIDAQIAAIASATASTEGR